jgi:hypothetical protein
MKMPLKTNELVVTVAPAAQTVAGTPVLEMGVLEI